MGRASPLLVIFLSVVIPFVLHAGASASAASISIRQDPSENCTLPCYPRAKFGVDSYEHQICDDPATIAGITSCINDNCAGDALVAAKNLLGARCNSVGVTLSFSTPSATSSTNPTDSSINPSAPVTTSSPIIAIISVFGGIAVLTLLTLCVIMYRSRARWNNPLAWDAIHSGDSGSGTGTGTGTGMETSSRGPHGTNHAQQQLEAPADVGGAARHSAASTGARPLSGVRDRPQVDDGYYEVLVRRVSGCGHQHPSETARPSIQEALEHALGTDSTRRPPVYEPSVGL